MGVTDRILGEAMTPHQKKIYKDPKKSCSWAFTNGKRFLEAEATIAKDPYWAYYYAKYVVGGRWPEGESTIAKSPEWAYYYARDAIHGRWPEGEATIAKSPEWAYFYSTDVIRGRWPEAEGAIARSEWSYGYLNQFPDAEEDWAIYGWIDWLDT